MHKERQGNPGIRLIVAGSRKINDESLVFRSIENIGMKIDEIVCGGASGVDKLGAKWAHSHGVKVKYFRPDWEDLSYSDAIIKEGRGGVQYDALAGIRRNRDMADYADVALVIWDGISSGSKNMLSEARKRGLVVIEVCTNKAVLNAETEK